MSDEAHTTVAAPEKEPCLKADQEDPKQHGNGGETTEGEEGAKTPNPEPKSG